MRVTHRGVALGVAIWLFNFLPAFSAWAFVPMEDVSHTKSELIQGTIPGFGDVKVRIDSAGEPVSRPLRISVDVSCGSDLSYRPVLTDQAACSYRELNYDKANQVLRLEVGAYDPESSKCSKRDVVTIQVRKVCGETASPAS